jgi:penicillin-binding protein 1A
LSAARSSPGAHDGDAAAVPLPPPGRARRRALAASAAAVALALAIARLAVGSGAARARLREEVARALEARVPGARLEGGARVDWRLQLVAGPIAIGTRPAGAPVVTIERAVVRPRLTALLSGRLEPAAVSLEGVRIDAGLRGASLARLADGWRGDRSGASARPGRAAPAPEIRFQDLRLRVVLTGGPDGAVVDLGPLSGGARVERAASGATAEADFAAPGGARGSARVGLGARGGFSARLDHLTASVIPASLRARIPLVVEAGDLSLVVKAPSLPDGARGEAHVEAVVADLTLRSEELASEVVGPLTTRIAGELRWDAAARRLSLGPARLDLGRTGRAGAEIALSLEAGTEPRFELDLRARDVDWEAALDALPPILRPPPAAPPVQGSLAGWLTVSGPVEHTERWRVNGDVDPTRLEAAGGGLALPFTWSASLPDGGTRPVVIGPANPDFVPLGALPTYVVRAVLASEDAGFFSHHGFDVHEIQDALAHADERSRLRGASTITQQLAKNLYLSPERTLLRKAREALATIALEASVGKRRLLEIYLNLVEWGPGVYGIGEAARHWFGKDARDLSPKEAAFLASVIPNPVRYDMYRRRGALTEVWEERVRELLMKLRAADVLTEEQLHEAWDAPLQFRGWSSPPFPGSSTQGHGGPPGAW